ncbi:MAG: hypothetical protein Q9Q40_06525 [Acidobacteriota bacterium]|nr:hypothetical protein [Acidobacteriota bacterium]
MEPTTLSLVLVTPRQHLFERTLDLLAEARDACFRLSWVRDLTEAEKALTHGCDLCLVDAYCFDAGPGPRMAIQRRQVPIVALVTGEDHRRPIPPDLPRLELDGLTPVDAARRLRQVARPAPPMAGLASAE